MARIGTLKLKAQLFRGEEIALGPGKADLLEAIAREGSISSAGHSMDMSYRRAWLLVDAMNRCWRGPLVETRPGKGAKVTALGRQVLSAYRGLEADLAEAARRRWLGELESLIASESREPEPDRFPH